MSSSDEKPTFSLPPIQDNPDGWGPSAMPPQFSDMPYAPFEKRAFLGRMADWSARAEQHRERYRNQNRQPSVTNDAFALEATEDTGFNLVDTSKMAQQPGWDKGMRGRYGRGRGRGFGGRGGRFQAQAPQGAEAKFNANFQKKKTPTAPVSKWRKNQQANQGFRWMDQRQARVRDASVDVRPDWLVKGQITFAELQKMNVTPPEGAEDVKSCGTLRYYDKNFDRITPKTEKPLAKVERDFFKVSCSDDPVIGQLVEGDAKEVADVKVFATDSVLAALMASPRSAFSWDIVVNRVGDKLFLDKRQDSPIDYVTANETANDFGDEDKDSINNPAKLTSEATFVNQNFSQQVLAADQTYPFEDPASPFVDGAEGAARAATVAYKYRKFEVGAAPKAGDADTRVRLLCRCELDGVVKGKQDEDLFMRLYALNEIDAKLANGIDWRQKLESQRGAVLATELKNNSNKLAKWTLQAMLAGADVIKLGYVSRVHTKDNYNHVILGTQQYKPKEFATHINLNVGNSWGILKAVIDLCLGFEEGKYLLMKDPNKQVLRFYAIPEDAFDNIEVMDDIDVGDDDGEGY